MTERTELRGRSTREKLLRAVPGWRLSWHAARTRLALQLALAAILVVALHMALMMGVNWTRERDIALGLERAQADTLTIEGWLRRSFDGIGLTLDLLQERQRLLDTNTAGAAAIEDILRGFVENRRFDIILALTIDPDGFSRWSNQANITTIDLRDRPHFQVHLQGHVGTYVADPVMGRLSRQMAVIFSRRINHPDGSFAGVAVVTLDPLLLSRQLVEIMPFPETRIGVSRLGGEVILRSRWAVEPPTGPQFPPPRIAAALAANETTPFLAVIPDAGRGLLNGIRRMDDLGLGLVVGHDLGIATRRSQQLGRLIWLADAVFASLLLAGLAVATTLRARRVAQAHASASAEREREAAITQAEVNRMLDTVPGVIYRGVFAHDGSFRLLYLSPSFSNVAGWPPEAAMAGSAGILDLGEAPPERAEQLARMALLRSQAVSTRDLRLRQPDGGFRWMRFAAHAVQERPDGLEVVGLMTDVEAERAAMGSSIAAGRLATLGEMATGLAHELSQPLSSMSMAAENAIRSLQRNKTEGLIERLERVPVQAQRARVIIDHLRLFGRQETDGRTPLRLDTVLEGAMVLVEVVLRGAGIELTLDIPPDLPLVVGNLVLLEQVVMNLLLNARDALAGQRDRPRAVRITATAAEGRVELRLSDTGTGIPESVLPRLFEPFFTTKPAGVGTGLGLSICHGIIHSLGGTITAGNTGHGAVFTITLPAVPQEARVSA
ncbi:MAG: ATP-binding protein [Roseococcus sp.]